MMGLKLTGGILLVVCGALAGLYAAGRSEKKAAFLREYVDFLHSLQSTIGYCSYDIVRVLEEAEDYPHFGMMLRETLEGIYCGYDFTSAWNEAAALCVQEGTLSDTDSGLLTAFAQGFGEMGSQEESARLGLHISRGEERLQELHQTVKAQKQIYRIVGTFCGVLIAVMVV